MTTATPAMVPQLTNKAVLYNQQFTRANIIVAKLPEKENQPFKPNVPLVGRIWSGMKGDKRNDVVNIDK